MVKRIINKFLCKRKLHLWGKWGFVFEPGEGSYHWERSCNNCRVGQFTMNPD